MFDLTPEDGRNITEATFQIAPGVDYTLVTGLVPDAAYLVEGEGRTDQIITSDDAGTLLIANVPPGGVRLTVQ
jgi:hypothetical protein